MPRVSPFSIRLSDEEHRKLKRRANSYTLPYSQVTRARMILLAAQGLGNNQIADRLDTRREVVSLWRKRFFESRLAGLEELPRPGRPRASPPEVVVQVRALACQLPTACNVPLSRWGVRDLGRATRSSGLQQGP